MKKVITILLVAMLMSLCACTANNDISTTADTENSSVETESSTSESEGSSETSTEPSEKESLATQPSTSCNHIYSDATCTTPKTCSKCGTTSGSAEGHSWKDATCTAPKTCSKCGTTSGSAEGHSWKDATCTAPKTCSKCGTTSGSAEGHSWKDATCTAPKTCSKCYTTEGSAGNHVVEGTFCKFCGQVVAVSPEKFNTSKQYVAYFFTSAGELCETSLKLAEALISVDYYYTTQYSPTASSIIYDGTQYYAGKGDGCPISYRLTETKIVFSLEGGGNFQCQLLSDGSLNVVSVDDSYAVQFFVRVGLILVPQS